MLPRELDIVGSFPNAALEEWQTLAQQDVGAASIAARLTPHLLEGIDLQPLYTRADWPGWSNDYSGYSGLKPFTRGSSALGNAARGWDIRQEHALPNAELLNRAMVDDLEHGVTSVLVRFDAAGREGLDADDAAAGPLVGCDGCSLSTFDELERAFKGVHLGMIHTSIEAGGAFVPAAAMLAALWENRGIATNQARGAFNADPLAVLARDGHLCSGLEGSLSLLADLASWTTARYQHVTAVRVGTAVYHHAGATVTQDLAFAMASALEYLRAMERVGMSVDQSARQMLFSFAVGSEFFLAASKLRAARRLWSRVVEACGGSAGSGAMAIHARPTRRIMSTRDPWTNILRNTACVFAAALGGANSIGCMAFDAPLGGTSGKARRLARNTQLILQEECSLHRVCDPLGGSWYIESLTDQIALKAWKILQEIESRGGMARCLIDGWIHSQIGPVAAIRANNASTRKKPVLGVSEFANIGEVAPTVDTAPSADVRAEALERTRLYRAKRKNAASVSAGPGGTGGWSAWAAAEAMNDRTLGEIARALPSHRLTFIDRPLALHTFGEAFERLRDASDEYMTQCGTRPTVFVASMGPAAAHKARTGFAKSFFESGGFRVLSGEGYASVDAAACACEQSRSRIAVIASDDETYRRLVPELAPALHRAGARTVVLAGNPGADEVAYRAAGVDRFIFVKCNVIEVLTDLLIQEGASL